MASIKFSLKKSGLPVANAPAYVACVKRNMTISSKELVKLMAESNTTVSRHDIIVVLDLLETVVKQQLLLGNRVNTGLFNAGVSISGGFDSAYSEIDSSMHKVNVRLRSAAELRAYIAKNANIEKVRGQERLPVIDRLFDFTSSEENKSVTPGRMAELRGMNLFLNGTDPEQGIYFVNDEANTKTKAETIHRQSSGTIMFTVPESLVTGSYTLLVKCGFGTEVREGKLNGEISVN